jgi:hypothetical protein
MKLYYSLCKFVRDPLGLYNLDKAYADTVIKLPIKQILELEEKGKLQCSLNDIFQAYCRLRTKKQGLK